MIAPTDLLDRWRADEARQRALGLHEAADLIACLRGELETWARERELEALTLRAAADYSGMSPETIRKKVSRGELANAGRRGAPRVRRCDLPQKPQGGDDEAVVRLADQIAARRGGPRS